MSDHPKPPVILATCASAFIPAHAGSLERAAINAHELGANTLQIFSASPRMWRAKPPDKQQVQLLNIERTKHDLTPLVIHSNYLINLAAPPSDVRENSIHAFRGEIERALIIGADYLVVHPGNYKNGLTLEQGMLNVAEAMALAWRAVDDDSQNQSRASPSCSKTPPVPARNSAAIFPNSPSFSNSPPNISISPSASASTPATATSTVSISLREAGFELLSRHGARNSRPRTRPSYPYKRRQSRLRFPPRPPCQHRRWLYWFRRLSAHPQSS